MRTLEVIITALSLVASSVAAAFAILAYRLQLSTRRKKGTLCIHNARNGSHVSVTATNEGRAVRVNRIVLATDGLGSLVLDTRHHTFKDGAPIDMSIDKGTLNKIPVNVKSRFVFALSDGSTLRSGAVCLSKILDDDAAVLIEELTNND